MQPLITSLALGLCPGTGPAPAWHPRVSYPTQPHSTTHLVDYHSALALLDLDTVRDDLRALFTSSQSSWPADYGNYAPFFVRLAWHCSGSYRLSDGRGGCEGGRQRFDPERSWADNTNLDKARSLLWPIKKKHGLGLSWGDLFILAGTTAVESMGGPTLGFCAGRIDDPDGTASLPLGPSAEQEKDWPCAVNGTCTSPLGSTTVGLIYLNPEGPMAQPNPVGSAPQVRDTFKRMSMNDSETVALIGGGHAFGKTHGACPAGPGPSPREDPVHPWPGRCGSGKGVDAFTSGMEGPWTTDPTAWDNNYFTNLLDYKWSAHKGPGGHWQWKAAVRNTTQPAPTAPAADGHGRQDIMMLTSDVSLVHDAAYKPIVTRFAVDQKAFEHAWTHAWYKLTTRDMGPVTRCMGDRIPPPQPWQFPLPPPPSALANFTAVAQAVRSIVMASPAHNGGLLVNLAWRCAATFRFTDYRGGCNGARIRLDPEASWPANAGWSARALELLGPVHHRFASSALSWSDLIVLAGGVAVEATGGPRLHFCGGRTDADDGAGSVHLEPVLQEDVKNATLDALREAKTLLGLSSREWVALVGGVRSLGGLVQTGFEGNATSSPGSFDNAFLVSLADDEWKAHAVASSGKVEYKSSATNNFAMPSDVLLRQEPSMMAVVQDLAVDADGFASAFAAAWHKVMVADRFDGRC